MCYNIRMSTTHTNGLPSRPCCCVCGADHVDDGVRATEYGAMCVMCVEDVRADMCADAHERATGYEADEENLLYWDQHAEG